MQTFIEFFISMYEISLEVGKSWGTVFAAVIALFGAKRVYVYHIFTGQRRRVVSTLSSMLFPLERLNNKIEVERSWKQLKNHVNQLSELSPYFKPKISNRLNTIIDIINRVSGVDISGIEGYREGSKMDISSYHQIKDEMDEVVKDIFK